jgi:hypothetical protein
MTITCLKVTVLALTLLCTQAAADHDSVVLAPGVSASGEITRFISNAKEHVFGNEIVSVQRLNDSSDTRYTESPLGVHVGDSVHEAARQISSKAMLFSKALQLAEGLEAGAGGAFTAVESMLARDRGSKGNLLSRKLLQSTKQSQSMDRRVSVRVPVEMMPMGDQSSSSGSMPIEIDLPGPEIDTEMIMQQNDTSLSDAVMIEEHDNGEVTIRYSNSSSSSSSSSVNGTIDISTNSNSGEPTTVEAMQSGTDEAQFVSTRKSIVRIVTDGTNSTIAINNGTVTSNVSANIERSEPSIANSDSVVAMQEDNEIDEDSELIFGFENPGTFDIDVEDFIHEKQSDENDPAVQVDVPFVEVNVSNDGDTEVNIPSTNFKAENFTDVDLQDSPVIFDESSEETTDVDLDQPSNQTQQQQKSSPSVEASSVEVSENGVTVDVNGITVRVDDGVTIEGPNVSNSEEGASDEPPSAPPGMNVTMENSSFTNLENITEVIQRQDME